MTCHVCAARGDPIARAVVESTHMATKAEDVLIGALPVRWI